MGEISKEGLTIKVNCRNYYELNAYYDRIKRTKKIIDNCDNNKDKGDGYETLQK